MTEYNKMEMKMLLIGYVRPKKYRRYGNKNLQVAGLGTLIFLAKPVFPKGRVGISPIEFPGMRD